MEDVIIAIICLIIILSVLGGLIFICCWCCSCCLLAKRRDKQITPQTNPQVIVIPANSSAPTMPMAAGTQHNIHGYNVLPQSDPLPSSIPYTEAPPPYSPHPYSSTYPETGGPLDEYTKPPLSTDEVPRSYQSSAPPLNEDTETRQILPEYSKPPSYNST